MVFFYEERDKLDIALSSSISCQPNPSFDVHLVTAIEFCVISLHLSPQNSCNKTRAILPVQLGDWRCTTATRRASSPFTLTQNCHLVQNLLRCCSILSRCRWLLLAGAAPVPVVPLAAFCTLLYPTLNNLPSQLPPLDHFLLSSPPLPSPPSPFPIQRWSIFRKSSQHHTVSGSTAQANPPLRVLRGPPNFFSPSPSIISQTSAIIPWLSALKLPWANKATTDDDRTSN